MSKINKYACKEEIEEFLDELKLENHVRQHGEIKAFVLEYMLKNPPGKGCVVQVGTFGKTTRSDTHGQNAHGLIISYVCPRLIPLAGDQLMQKRIGGHHVCCRYDGSTKQYVIQIQFNQSNEITDAPINAAKENMTDMFYHTDEYVTENEIDNFLKCLQLEWLIKEHQAVREFIRGILIDNLPVPNRTIKVTTIGEIPASVGQLPLISGINRTKEFGCRIAYQRDERFSVPNKTISQMLFGDHFAQAGHNDSAKEFVICIQFNKFNEDVIKAQNYNQINKETIQKVFAEHMRTDKVTQGSDSTIAHQSQMHNPESTSTDDSKGRVPMEEILSRLKELDVDPSWIRSFTDYASIYGFKASLPEPHLTPTKDKVYITFGDPDSAAAAGFSKLKLNSFKSPMEWAINKHGGVFHIPRAEANR